MRQKDASAKNPRFLRPAFLAVHESLGAGVPPGSKSLSGSKMGERKTRLAPPGSLRCHDRTVLGGIVGKFHAHTDCDSVGAASAARLGQERCFDIYLKIRNVIRIST